MAKIQGVNVRTMAGEAVPTRETRRAECAWLYAQARATGVASAASVGEGDFPTATKSKSRASAPRGGVGRRH
jgi:phage-related protein